MISGISNDHLSASAPSTMHDEMYGMPDINQDRYALPVISVGEFFIIIFCV